MTWVGSGFSLKVIFFGAVTSEASGPFLVLAWVSEMWKRVVDNTIYQAEQQYLGS
jgi:hypothetical protein